MSVETESLRVSIRHFAERASAPAFAVGMACCVACAHAASPCVSQAHFRQARADLLAADAETARGHYLQASDLLLAGIQILGPHYFDDRRVSWPAAVLDDTGMELQVAQALAMKGDMKDAAVEQRASLDNRLDLAKSYGMCIRTR
jgi:hypothetical protein